MGHEVVSSWLNEIAHPAGMDEDTFFKKVALRDLCEIYSADLLIVDTFDETPRGGREVEFGFAFGHFQNKTTYIVGPLRNAFHRLADERFESWEECLEWLDPRPPKIEPIPELQANDPYVAMMDQAWLEREHSND